MDKQELIGEVAAAALQELEKFEQRRIQVASPVDIVKEVFKGMRDPQPAENNAPGVVRIPQVPPEFPKLLVSYDKEEWAVVENFNDWRPIHHFWVRPLSELDGLKEAGFTERAKTSWERRKQKGAA